MSVLGHYSSGLRPDLLQAHATERVNDILQRVPKDSIPVLVFTGFSGIAFATALALEFYKLGYPIDLMLVRKPQDQSHGNPVHCSTTDFKDRIYIFVDDFISSGATFTRLNTVVSHYGGIRFVCEQDRLKLPNDADFTGITANEIEYYTKILRPKNAM